MADEAESKSSVPLPPKLDLRKSGILKPIPVPGPVVTAPPAEAPVVPAVSPAVSPAGNPNSSTMHIKLQGEAPTVRIAPAPLPVASGAGQARPAPTIEVKKPLLQPSSPPSMAVKPLVVTPASPPAEKRLSSKSETSRIPLELATTMAANAVPGKPTGDLKTIKIKPSAATAGAKVVIPPAPDKPSDDKRKTSRISLESALAMDDKGGERNAPKTIRLKRPGEATAKASPTLDTIQAAPSADKAAMSQTARLDEATAEEEEGPSPTRRKTIKMKRPGEKPGMKIMTGGGAEAATSGAAETEAEGPDTSGVGVFDWIAMAVAVVTVIMTFVVMLMLASQAWGPNPCLTELSSWKTGPDFGWTGKTQPIIQ